MIKLNGVNKAYFIRENPIPVLKDIHLTIEAGEFVSIMGPSGSGKSTLMNLIGLLDRPSSGNYYFENEDVSQFDSERLAKLRNTTVGFIFQSFMLLPRMNLIENVSLPLLYQEVSKEHRISASCAMLEKVGLKDYADRKPTELSGGQQQRVAIARALVTQPKIILADEPTGALDSQTGQEIFELLKELNKTLRTTIIVVTHDRKIADQCERIIRLQDGAIVT
jgi:putative ABC transport system ATP-binding protein